MQPLCDGGETLEPQGFNRNGTLLIHGSNRSHASLQRFWSANLLRFIYWNSTPWRFHDKLDASPSPLHEKSLGVSKHVHHGFRYLNYIPSPSSCIVGTLDSWKKMVNVSPREFPPSWSHQKVSCLPPLRLHVVGTKQKAYESTNTWQQLMVWLCPNWLDLRPFKKNHQDMLGDALNTQWHLVVAGSINQ